MIILREGFHGVTILQVIRIFIVEDKTIQNSINLKTTSLYTSTNTFQAICLNTFQTITFIHEQHIIGRLEAR